MLLFNRLESTQELREITQLPVVAGLPHYAEIEEHPLAILADSRAQITEAFRSLRTNLQYLLAQEGANTILVSSFTQGKEVIRFIEPSDGFGEDGEKGRIRGF